MKITQIHKQKYHNIIYTDEDTAIIKRHTEQLASENPITGEERLINSLCDKIIELKKENKKLSGYPRTCPQTARIK